MTMICKEILVLMKINATAAPRTGEFSPCQDEKSTPAGTIDVRQHALRQPVCQKLNDINPSRTAGSHFGKQRIYPMPGATHRA